MFLESDFLIQNIKKYISIIYIECIFCVSQKRTKSFTKVTDIIMATIIWFITDEKN